MIRGLKLGGRTERVKGFMPARAPGARIDKPAENMTSSSDSRRLHAFVSGRVQGVFFRARTCEVATRLGLAGWVRNLPDGRVELLAEGPGEALEQLLAFCRVGPAGARVDDVNVAFGVASGGLGAFEVRG